MAKKLAIGTWAYCFGPYADHPVPFDESVRKIAEIGFDGLELAGFRPHVHPDDYADSESRRQVRRLVEDHGLAICGLAADFSEVPPAVAPIDQYERVFRKNLKLCGDLGIPKLRVDTISDPPNPPAGLDYDTAWSRVATAWHRCAGLAQEAGVKLVWEFEPGFLFNKPAEVERMVQDVNHPNFSVLFDTCHANMIAVVGARQSPPKETLPGGVPEMAQRLAGHIGHVHFIDSDGSLHGDVTSTHAPFGRGYLDFDAIVPAILAAGYADEWWGVDLCFWPEAWQVSADAKRFMDGLRARYG